MYEQLCLKYLIILINITIFNSIIDYLKNVHIYLIKPEVFVKVNMVSKTLSLLMYYPRYTMALFALGNCKYKNIN